MAAHARPLLAAHDLLLVDLDGVVYIGSEPVAGAVEALNAATDVGCGVVYVTNNASRPPETVVDHLVRLGLRLAPQDVLTSAQATAAVVRADSPAGTPVLAIGGPGVRDALESVGLVVVDSPQDSPHVVVMGFGPDVSWRHLAQATQAIRAGAAFIATNTDQTVPTSFGPAPGNGALVAAVAQATGVQPRVIGKPQPTMFEHVTAARGAIAPLVIGDRLDTDIQGATHAGMRSLLVMTGVTDAVGLLNATSGQRPTYVAAGVAGLMLAHPPTLAFGRDWRCGKATAHRQGGRIEVTSPPDGQDDGLNGLRAACAAAWNASVGETSGETRPVITHVIGLSDGLTG